MPPAQKDLKILWAKAAGRCSIETCRRRLVANASQSVPSQRTLVGDACHIVAESPNGPRGTSVLTSEQRNRYPNLILLCNIDHTIVDGDPAAWPIELLYQTKIAHELWVESQLAETSGLATDAVYSALINSATKHLLLDRWDWVTDHAVRGLLFDEFVQGASTFTSDVFRAVWPGTRPLLEEELKNLAARANSYVTTFLQRACQRDTQVWVEDRAWKAVWRSDYQKRLAASRAWEAECMNLLRNVVVALNSFSDAVRSTIKPDYFLIQGRFVITDSLGVTNNLNSIEYLPDTYSE